MRWAYYWKDVEPRAKRLGFQIYRRYAIGSTRQPSYQLVHRDPVSGQLIIKLIDCLINVSRYLDRVENERKRAEATGLEVLLPQRSLPAGVPRHPTSY